MIHQLKSIYAGECDVAVINHYYYGKLTYSKNPDHREWAKASFIVFPNQGQDDRGAHVNISGGGVVKFSKNKKLAINFLEFLDANKISFQIVFTKIDKINKKEKEVLIKGMQFHKLIRSSHPFFTSSKTKLGVKNIKKQIVDNLKKP